MHDGKHTQEQRLTALTLVAMLLLGAVAGILLVREHAARCALQADRFAAAMQCELQSTLASWSPEEVPQRRLDVWTQLEPETLLRGEVRQEPPYTWSIELYQQADCLGGSERTLATSCVLLQLGKTLLNGEERTEEPVYLRLNGLSTAALWPLYEGKLGALEAEGTWDGTLFTPTRLTLDGAAYVLRDAPAPDTLRFARTEVSGAVTTEYAYTLWPSGIRSQAQLSRQLALMDGQTSGQQILERDFLVLKGAQGGGGLGVRLQIGYHPWIWSIWQLRGTLPLLLLLPLALGALLASLWRVSVGAKADGTGGGCSKS